MKNKTLQELLDIIDAGPSADFQPALDELKVRLAVLSKGGDRPDTPPKNP